MTHTWKWSLGSVPIVKMTDTWNDLGTVKMTDTSKWLTLVVCVRRCLALEERVAQAGMDFFFGFLDTTTSPSAFPSFFSFLPFLAWNYKVMKAANPYVKSVARMYGTDGLSLYIRVVPKKIWSSQEANERVLPTDFRSVLIFFLKLMADFSFPIKIFKNQRGDPWMKKIWKK